jgi:hypothetical protein
MSSSDEESVEEVDYSQTVLIETCEGDDAKNKSSNEESVGHSLF